jgi:hypothetical protein
MTKYVHIVQVHPVENGEPNLAKVILKKEFETRIGAERWTKIYDGIGDLKAVYIGRVNDATGELE